MAYFKKKTENNSAPEESPELTLEGWYRDIFHTGSRVICDHPPEDTDDDYLLLVGEGAVRALESKLLKDGYELGGSFKPGVLGLAGMEDPLDFDSFASYKKGEMNIILTCNDEYFLRFKNATFLAKKLNLLKKEDRVSLFEAVVRDKYPEPVDKNWWRSEFQGSVARAPGRPLRVAIPNVDWREFNNAVHHPVIRPENIRGMNAEVIIADDFAAVEERIMAFGNANVDGNGNIIEDVREMNVQQGDVQQIGAGAVNPAAWLVAWGDRHVEHELGAEQG